MGPASNSFEFRSSHSRSEDPLLAAHEIGMTILDTIAALVVVINPQGQIVLFNRACERVTGYSFKEIRGEILWDFLLTPEEVEPVRAVFQDLIAGHFPNEYENYWVARDGSMRLIAWTNTALLNASGAVEYVIGTGIDVTERRRAEQAQRENEQLYASLFKNNHAVMLLIHPETGQIVDANPAACSFYGYRPEELAGLKITDINTLTAGEVFEEMERARSEARKHFLFRHRLANGKIRDVEVYSGPIQFGGKSLLYSIIHDITERKQAEAQRDQHLNRLNTIIDAMKEAVAIYDPQGNFLQVNPAVVSAYGFDPTGQNRREVLSRLTIHHLDGSPLQFDELPSGRALHGESVRGMQLIFTNIHGEELYIQTSSAPLFLNDEFFGAVVVWHDITELKRAQEALKVQMRQLERTNQELQDFVFIASHDLQEPLRKIQVFADRLKTRYEPVLDEDGQEYLERIQTGANRLQRMIQDLLAYSRVTTQAKPFVRTDLTQVAREVVSDLEVRIEQSGGQVIIEKLPEIEADPLQIRQLLQNLIGNALKFRRPGVKPVVRVYAKFPQVPLSSPRSEGTQGNLGELRGTLGELVQVIVEDNGVGFEEQYLNRVFQPFQRLHNQQIYEGTGIGLAICRKIAERHSGSITARSIPGQGTTFIVTLPRKQGQAISD